MGFADPQHALIDGGLIGNGRRGGDVGPPCRQAITQPGEVGLQLGEAWPAGAVRREKQRVAVAANLGPSSSREHSAYTVTPAIPAKSRGKR